MNKNAEVQNIRMAAFHEQLEKRALSLSNISVPKVERVLKKIPTSFQAISQLLGGISPPSLKDVQGAAAKIPTQNELSQKYEGLKGKVKSLF